MTNCFTFIKWIYMVLLSSELSLSISLMSAFQEKKWPILSQNTARKREARTYEIEMMKYTTDNVAVLNYYDAYWSSRRHKNTSINHDNVVCSNNQTYHFRILISWISGESFHRILNNLVLITWGPYHIPSWLPRVAWSSFEWTHAYIFQCFQISLGGTKFFKFNTRNAERFWKIIYSFDQSGCNLETLDITFIQIWHLV